MNTFEKVSNLSTKKVSNVKGHVFPVFELKRFEILELARAPNKERLDKT